MKLLTGLLFLLILIFAGCKTLTPEERRAIDAQSCASFGFKRGTTAFSTCLLDLELDRRADRRAQFEQFNTPVIVYDGRYRGW
ncbi:hypothetical protein CU102_00145 [Phyllobacterium brassicacearum]|uniref:Lipoprotein n=1 Tax=Phyllobacterium brassicacearum TaxID=314235 RepID=A0A2P7BVL8_9HYPH|nr:hypothetical protein [Phyllobacterium brassicacearum]PSH70515.1 hypothetical protein CU102_00145 [Phyllobacterium brassicacearum]TDQ36041.1 hypothetical protein DEV91_101527 [Phyllobacterium brassicacearum]